MAVHRMTPARRAALKKAQAASARKRRGTGKGKLAAANRKGGISRKRRAFAYGSIAVGYGALGVAAHRTYRKPKTKKSGKPKFVEPPRKMKLTVKKHYRAW